LCLKTVATAISVQCLFAFLDSKFIEKTFLENLVSVHPMINSYILTPWRLGGFGNFCKKNSSFQLPYQHPKKIFFECNLLDWPIRLSS